MIYKSILVLLVLLMSLPLGMAQAQDSTDSTENACFEGGLMAGKCDTEWEFICGYYLAQWLNNGGWSNLANNTFPTWCNPASLLPARPQGDLAEDATTDYCYSFIYDAPDPYADEPYSIWYTGPANVLGNAIFYFTNATCSGGQTGNSFFGVVDAASFALCDSWVGGATIKSDLTPFGLPGLYGCFMD